MTHRSESPTELMAIIKDQYPSRVGFLAIKEGSRKIAEINFDPDDIAPNTILQQGIHFDESKSALIPCRALDDNVYVVRVYLSNLPFLKEEKLLHGLTSSLSPYGEIVGLGICYEPTTHTFMGSGYAVLNTSASNKNFEPLVHYLPWRDSDTEGIYAVWNMPSYCCYCHETGHEANPPAKDSEHVTHIAVISQDDQEDSMSDVPNESSSELNVEQAIIEDQYDYRSSINTSANHDVSVNNLDNVNNSSDMEISEDDEFYTGTNAQFVNSPTESTQNVSQAIQQESGKSKFAFMQSKTRVQPLRNAGIPARYL